DASIDYDKDGTIKPEGGGAGQESRLATDNRCDTGASPTSPCPNYPWRRLLVGAMGAGGKKITVGSNTWSSSIFVLDITDPTSPVLLWEKPMPDNTLTTSNPATVVRLASAATDASKSENGKWYLVMGSGAESITTNKLNYKTSENAKIYVFDLRTGNLEATLDIGASGVAVGDMMAVDYDSDYQVDDIYFGTYGGTTGAYTGKFYRLRLRSDTAGPTVVYQSPANWDIETVVDVGRPIFASPEVAHDVDKNIWLYFGTGVYLTLEHAAATPSVNEYLYAVKETEGCWNGLTARASCTYSNFLDTSGMNFTGAKAVELGCFCAGSLLRTIPCEAAGSCAGTCASGEDTVVLKVQEATLTGTGIPTTPTNCTASPNNTDTSAIACLTAAINASYNGWRRAITGQKSFSKPFVAGGLVDFTTFEPTSTSCSLGGNTHLYALHYTTGTAYVQPTIFLAGGTEGAAMNNLTIKASVDLGTGVPPLGESLVALPLAGDTYKVITQVSGGLPGTSMSPSLPAKGGYVLWIVK
ncbi:MAG: PilC/PilY family type IV pilus protein, partial [Thermodesulfovibrionales bacterium]